MEQSHVYENKLSAVKESQTTTGFDGAALPPLRNPPLLEKAEDLTTLSHLNEPSGERPVLVLLS